jgi:hypothetical protein
MLIWYHLLGDELDESDIPFAARKMIEYCGTREMQ